jgi:hypothetical protein
LIERDLSIYYILLSADCHWNVDSLFHYQTPHRELHINYIWLTALAPHICLLMNIHKIRWDEVIYLYFAVSAWLIERDLSIYYILLSADCHWNVDSLFHYQTPHPFHPLFGQDVLVLCNLVAIFTSKKIPWSLRNIDRLPHLT